MAAEVVGIGDLRRKLLEIPKVMRRRVLRNALAAGARLVRDEAKRQAPVLKVPAPHRQPGTLRKAIAVRTSKQARRDGNVGVFVNVRPAKRGQRGAKMPTDPFYWRWVEFGTKKMTARPFLRPAGERLQDALRVFGVEVARWIAKINGEGRVE